MIDAYVISLARRPDRLAGFRDRMSSLAPSVNFQTFNAFDGRKLDLPALGGRLNPANFTGLNERRIRGQLGAALSHLAVWDLALRAGVSAALVFEDDVTPLRSDFAIVMDAVVAAAAKGSADLVWLNEDIFPRSDGFERWIVRRLLRALPSPPPPRPGDRLAEAVFRAEQFWRWRGERLKTSEAYLISAPLMRVLSAAITDDLGCIDVRMQRLIAKLPARVFELKTPLFAQLNRGDTDIQLDG